MVRVSAPGYLGPFGSGSHQAFVLDDLDAPQGNVHAAEEEAPSSATNKTSRISLPGNAEDLFAPLSSMEGIMPAKAQAYLSLLADSSITPGHMRKHLINLLWRGCKVANIVLDPLDGLTDIVTDAGRDVLLAKLGLRGGRPPPALEEAGTTTNGLVGDHATTSSPLKSSQPSWSAPAGFWRAESLVRAGISSEPKSTVTANFDKDPVAIASERGREAGTAAEPGPARTHSGWSKLRGLVFGAERFGNGAVMSRGSVDDSSLLLGGRRRAEGGGGREISEAHAKVLSIVISMMVSGLGGAAVHDLTGVAQATVMNATSQQQQQPRAALAAPSAVASSVVSHQLSESFSSGGRSFAMQSAPSLAASAGRSAVLQDSASDAASAGLGAMASSTALKLLRADSKRGMLMDMAGSSGSDVSKLLGNLLDPVLDTVRESMDENDASVHRARNAKAALAAGGHMEKDAGEDKNDMKGTSFQGQ